MLSHCSLQANSYASLRTLWEEPLLAPMCLNGAPLTPLWIDTVLGSHFLVVFIYLELFLSH